MSVLVGTKSSVQVCEFDGELFFSVLECGGIIGSN